MDLRTEEKRFEISNKMKYILVSDDIGTPLYLDHPDGRMLCMPIPTTQDVMHHNFNDAFSSMVCGKFTFVFQKVKTKFHFFSLNYYLPSQINSLLKKK